MIAKKDVAAEKRQAQGVKRVREMLEAMLPDDEKEEEDGGTAAPGKETSVIVNQLACKEAGCPDVEVVMTLLRAKPKEKLMFKVYKAAADLSEDEVSSALKKAMAEEQGVAEAHDHGHAEHGVEHGHGEDHGHGDDCDCGHDHGHGHEGHANAESMPKAHAHDH